MGRHYLIQGDARDTECLGRPLGHRRVDVVFTDPPYNLSIEKDLSRNGTNKHAEFLVASGELSPAEFKRFLMHSFEAMIPFCRDGAILFTFIDWRHFSLLQSAGEATNLVLKNVCVWNKPNGGMGAFYRSQFELVLAWKFGTADHVNTFKLGETGQNRTTVWTYPGVNTFKAGRAEELAMHPTVKPVALIADALRDVSHRGAVVLDPFGGSGSTLIAAHQTGRLGFLVDKDPLYCDVTIRRFQKLTGKSAILVDTGQSFDEIEATLVEKTA